MVAIKAVRNAEDLVEALKAGLAVLFKHSPT